MVRLYNGRVSFVKRIARKESPLELLALVLCVGVVVIVAFFLNDGHHGLYADDWVYKFFGSGLAQETWTPQQGGVTYRVLAVWLAPIVASALPEYEISVRIGIIGLHLLNVILLAWLAMRLTDARWTAFVAGALFLIPLFAYESLLWFSAGIFYLIPLLLLLLGFHALLSCHSLKRQIYLPALALIAWSAMLLFIESGLLVPLLIAPMSWMVKRRGIAPERRAWLGTVTVFYLIAGAYLWFALRGSAVIAVHGETAFDPLLIVTQRLPQVAESVGGYFAEWLARGVFADAFEFGVREWLATSWFWILAILLVIGCWISAREIAKSETRELENREFPNSLALCVLGIAWFVLALAPVLFIQGLGVSSRVMYFPSAGLALGAAGLLSWVVEKLGAWRMVGARIILVGIIIFVFVNALAMAGLLRVYQLRYEQDMTQLDALRGALHELPEGRTWLMAHALDQSPVRTLFGRATKLNRLLYGLFDIPWAAEPALWLAYRSERIEMIDKDDQGNVRISDIEFNTDHSVNALVFRGLTKQQTVPVTRLLAFTYRGEKLYWLDPLLLFENENASPLEIQLPLAQTIGGAPLREAKLGLEKE